ncbi:hypothetical protein [Duganella vulcania]|uniref:DUF3828 domain-containing protein n=1 Tax=Duganella vulcania TaxID=2692166 RepID=A0A845GRV2_9BURK|nr:hypothetical protein [Duganella vulcania]MYM96150.1 hypothetical protein [Duganella vulcania]
MRFTENSFGRIILALGAVALASVALTAYTTQTNEYEQQMEFVKKYYNEYLSVPDGQRRPPPEAYFSRQLAQLLATRRQLCERLARDGGRCDDIAETLSPTAASDAGGFTFDKAGLREVHFGGTTVDVLDKPPSEDSIPVGRRYLLVKQAEGWRVANILYSRWGYFSTDNSMRQDVEEDIQSRLFRAGDIQVTAGKVFQVLKNENTLADAERYIKYPVQLCGKDGLCSTAQKDDPKVRQTIADWHAAHYNRVGDDPDDDHRFVIPTMARVPAEPAEEGKVVVLDALSYTFQDQAWWISKIDLSKVIVSGARHVIQ